MANLNGPIPNPFRKFNNMTYGISLYLQSPKNYADMMDGKGKNVKEMELLVQSGGISNNDVGNFGAKRNEFFTRDFYFDDLQLHSYIAGTAVGGPQNTFEVKFTITEPMGLTFMDRLYKASTKFAKDLGYVDFNPVNQLYLLVIRFYGYDKNGKQVLNGKFDDGSDSESYIEKWIPIMIRQIQFKIESSKVVYACECVCPQTQAAHGQVHGTIPFNMAVQGKTLEDLLNGENPKKIGGVVTQGLMKALNEHQKTMVTPDNKKYEYADQYFIELPKNIANALASPPGTPVINRSASPGTAKGKDISKLATGSAKSINGVQTYATNTGMKIAKFIDLAIRSSTYISSQYKKINDANKDGTTEFKKINPGPLKWFKIRPRVEILNFDKNRQSWAYKITYVVSEYEVSTVDTADFNPDNCFPIHKEYDYWFTGLNTEVLEFKQDFNTFYYTTFSAKHREDPNKNPKAQTNFRAMKTYRANSTESNQGSENMESEQAANAASVLYAPQDIANCEIDILGDPDWLSQSELYYAARTDPGEKVLNDGSVNYDRAEVFFTVNFNTVVDYSLDTGLADVTTKNVSQRLDGADETGVSQYAFVYRANTIISQFEKGKFTQQLKGTMVFLPEACITGQAENKRPGTKENPKPPVGPSISNKPNTEKASDLFKPTASDINLESFRPVNIDQGVGLNVGAKKDFRIGKK